MRQIEADIKSVLFRCDRGRQYTAPVETKFPNYYSSLNRKNEKQDFSTKLHSVVLRDYLRRGV